MHDLFIGQLLFNRFLIKKRLGEGGMAIIYLAEQLSVGRNVVLKMLKQEYLQQQSFLDRFKKEAKLMTALDHPQVVKLYDYGVFDDGCPFLVMPYLEGQTLKQRLPPNGFPVEYVIALARQLAEVLGAVHQAGVIHADVTLDNVMVGKGGRITLFDFGIARGRLVETLGLPANAHEVEGTPECMAPERITDNQCDERSDIYAWAVVVYAMLCGTLPVTGDDPYQVMAKQCKEQPRPVRELCPSVPVALERLVMRALKKRPRKRPQSMDEVLSLLRGTQPAPVVVKPESFQATVPVHVRGSWGRRGLVMGILLVGAVTGQDVLGGILARMQGSMPPVKQQTEARPQPVPAHVEIALNAEEQSIAQELTIVRRLYMRRKQYDEAITALERVLEKSPDNEEARKILRNVREEQRSARQVGQRSVRRRT